MLTAYIEAAMRRATYQLLEDDGSFVGEISGVPGVWSNASTLEACRDELREALEDWLVIALSTAFPIPEIDGRAA